MPERITRTCLKATLPGSGDEACDRLVICGREIERFVELAAARKLRLARSQSCVLRDLSQIHVMEAGHAHVTFLRDLIERGADFLIRSAQGDAQIARDTRRTWNSDVEVTIREKYSAASFSDEWMVVPEFAPQRLDFRARSRGDQHHSDVPAVEFGQGIFRFGK